MNEIMEKLLKNSLFNILNAIVTLIFIAIIGTTIININLSTYDIEAFYTLDSKACLIVGIVFSVINFALYFFGLLLLNQIMFLIKP
jgi:hypothetical protein